MKKQEAAPAAAGEEGKKAEETEEDKNEPLSEEGLTASNIDMVMQHTSCSRNEAIKALRKSNDDMVNAIMHLTS